MFVELSQDERDLLTQLVVDALRNIGPEIRRTQTYDYKDDLKRRRRVLQRLCDHLTAAPPPPMVSQV